MAWSLRTVFAILIVMLLAPLATAQDRSAQENQTAAPAAPMGAPETFSPAQAREIENIVKNYLVQHPEVLQDAMEALDRRQKEADADKARVTIKDNQATACYVDVHGEWIFSEVWVVKNGVLQRTQAQRGQGGARR